MGRLDTAAEFAALGVFLCSARASYITGSIRRTRSAMRWYMSTRLSGVSFGETPFEAIVANQLGRLAE